MTSSTRDRILDALEAVLLDKGMSRVTLENVAAAAGVSKGGLLYHFKSKEALLTGLVGRLGARVEQQLAETRAKGGGVAEWYLQTPDPQDTSEAVELELYRSMLATMRTVDATSGSGGESIQRALADLMASWSDGLEAEVGDQVRADLIRLVGDGVYLRALLGIAPMDPQRYRRVVERLLGR
ncbi:TetR/AcrR family transcriptional regulator [Nocardia higoensis]|uniref:TetR/AcrR family transcriptional regulator n=1 Tax=Nocardia higoensis TaxID=228599 RepID=A0ABS0D997_9NOCA|nr:TetR/AcrR family transcriptional regulator [Nocardia higoensis]MBF6354971.1 TetR/AcrR family transcriptional regulator [Nocardia higoensis]